MTPYVWLALWLVAAGVLLILGAIGAYPVGYRRGYAAAATEEPRHRKGDPLPPPPPLPRAGRIPLARLADPTPLPGEAPLFLFTGEPTRGWGAESAEYELLTQAPRCPCCGEKMSRDPHNPDFCWTCGLYASDSPDECDVHRTQTAEQPASVTGEPPIDTGEIMAITDRVDAWIADMAAQGNYDRHTMRAD